jgi:hypothetical protein
MTDAEKTEAPRTWRKRLSDWLIYLFCFVALCMVIAHMSDIGHGIEHRIGQGWNWSFAFVERQIDAA